MESYRQEHESEAGVPYILSFSSDKLYHWRGNSIPTCMQGSFTGKTEAMRMLDIWNLTNRKDTIDYTLTPLEQLEVYTRKTELIPFADSLGIELPDNMSNPAQIKKFIRVELEILNEG